MSLYPRITRALELGLPSGPYSNMYFVDFTNGNDSSSGTRPEKPLLTSLAGYNKCVAGQHDAVIVISGPSGTDLSAALYGRKTILIL